MKLFLRPHHIIRDVSFSTSHKKTRFSRLSENLRNLTYMDLSLTVSLLPSRSLTLSLCLSIFSNSLVLFSSLILLLSLSLFIKLGIILSWGYFYVTFKNFLVFWLNNNHDLRSYGQRLFLFFRKSKGIFFFYCTNHQSKIYKKGMILESRVIQFRYINIIGDNFLHQIKRKLWFLNKIS